MSDIISAFKSFDDAIQLGDVGLRAETQEQRDEFVGHLHKTGWRHHIHMESYEIYARGTGFQLDFLELAVDTEDMA